MFILPTRATRIRYQSRSGGLADCTIPAGRTSARCLIYNYSTVLNGSKSQATETVIISGFKVTLSKPARPLVKRADS